MTDKTQRAKLVEEREELFAWFCAYLGSPWEAARRAGFAPHLADAAACTLMGKKSVRSKIRRCEKKMEQDLKGFAIRGLLRLAGYPAGDGVRLVSGEDTLTPEAIDRMDLFGVSSLKRAGGGCEVKFFDRMRPLELLLALDKGSDGSPESFYQALRESAARVGAESAGREEWDGAATSADEGGENDGA